MFYPTETTIILGVIGTIGVIGTFIVYAYGMKHPVTR